MLKELENFKELQNLLFSNLFLSILILILLISSIKDLYNILKFGRKGLKKIKLTFLIFLLLFCIGSIFMFFYINDRIVKKKIEMKTLTKCYNEKLEKKKEEIIEECEK